MIVWLAVRQADAPLASSTASRPGPGKLSGMRRLLFSQLFGFAAVGALSAAEPAYGDSWRSEAEFEMFQVDWVDMGPGIDVIADDAGHGMIAGYPRSVLLSSGRVQLSLHDRAAVGLDWPQPGRYFPDGSTMIWRPHRKVPEALGSLAHRGAFAGQMYGVAVDSDGGSALVRRWEPASVNPPRLPTIREFSCERNDAESGRPTEGCVDVVVERRSAADAFRLPSHRNGLAGLTARFRDRQCPTMAIGHLSDDSGDRNATPSSWHGAVLVSPPSVGRTWSLGAGLDCSAQSVPAVGEDGKPADRQYRIGYFWPDGSITLQGGEASSTGLAESIWETRLQGDSRSWHFNAMMHCAPEDIRAGGGHYTPDLWSMEIRWFEESRSISEAWFEADGLREGMHFVYEPGGSLVSSHCFRGGLRHGISYFYGVRGDESVYTLVGADLYSLGVVVGSWRARVDEDIVHGECPVDQSLWRGAGGGVGELDESDEEPSVQVPWWADSRTRASKWLPPWDFSTICAFRLGKVPGRATSREQSP